MAKIYRITPLEKKSISAHYEMFRDNADGSTSWFNVDDHYRWGQGFVEDDLDLPYDGDQTVYCKPSAGWGAELDDSVMCDFEFSDDLTDEEKQEIEESYRENGAGWLYDGDHNWEFEDDSIIIVGPYQVDLCEDNGDVVEENIKLKARPDPNTSWPWSVEFPKPQVDEEDAVKFAKDNGLEL